MDLRYDIFLGGPPDRRSPFPYKRMIMDACPGLAIYDWEAYEGKDYQEQNHLAIRQSAMLVSMVPAFPMPGVGPEVGYFYCCHEDRIKRCKKEGVCLGMKRVGTFGNGDPHLCGYDYSDPFDSIILIWPDSVQPDFAKKTLAQYGLIVPTAEEAIRKIKALTRPLKLLKDEQRRLVWLDIADQLGNWTPILPRPLISSLEAEGLLHRVEANQEPWEKPAEERKPK